MKIAVLEISKHGATLAARNASASHRALHADRGTNEIASRSPCNACRITGGEQEPSMDHDRVKGAVKQKVGEAKEAAGKVLGDEKLIRKGQAEEVAGKVQNIVGGVKDTLRDKK
jgi:uncharacterized protein YjbJ (UPF0337 family)